MVSENAPLLSVGEMQTEKWKECNESKKIKGGVANLPEWRTRGRVSESGLERIRLLSLELER